MTVWPVFDSDEADGQRFVLLSFGSASDLLQLNGASLEVVDDGVVVMSTPAATWIRHQPLDLIVDPEGGQISLISTDRFDAAGSAWTWPDGVTLRVDGEVGGTAEWYGRIGPPGRD